MAQVRLLSDDTFVSPRTPTPQPCERALSPIDQLLPFRSYAKQVFYYKEAVSPADDFSDLVSKLKESLSTTLSYFYALAGRVEARNGKPGSYFLNCNDAGIPFRTAVAEWHLWEWSDLAQQDACRLLERQLYDAEEFPTSSLSTLAVIKVQVTKFLCGSIAVGYVNSEIGLDGFSDCYFLRTWAEVNRTGMISELPLFDWEILQARNPPKVVIPVTDYGAVPQPPVAAYDNCIITPAPAAPHGGVPLRSNNKTKLFLLTADKMSALVQEIHNGPHCSSFRPTSFEAMAGLAWKCITEARQLPDDDTTFYHYAVTLRGNERWTPRVPANLIANAVHLAVIEASAKDIKEKHVSYAVSRVHEDGRRLGADMMRSMVDWIHVQTEKGLAVEFACDLRSGKVVTTTSLYNIPVYDTDFGWGRPFYFSLILEPLWGDGIAYMLPTPQGGRSKYLQVSLPEEHLSRLCTHPLFCKFAAPATVLTTTSGYNAGGTPATTASKL